MQSYKFNYKDYNAKIQTSRNAGFTLLIIAIVLLLGVAFFLKPKIKSSTEFYFVEADCVLNYNKANALASEIQTRDGAGYIYFDKQYHIILNYYSNIDDATAVCKNIISEYPNACVYTKSVNINIAKNLKLQKELRNLIINNNYLIENLNTCISNYVTNTDSKEKFFVNLHQLFDRYKTSVAIVNNLVKENKLYSTSCNYILNNVESCNTLLDLKNDSDIKYKLRYQLVNIVFNHCSFLSCL